MPNDTFSETVSRWFTAYRLNPSLESKNSILVYILGEPETYSQAVRAFVGLLKQHLGHSSCFGLAQSDATSILHCALVHSFDAFSQWQPERASLAFYMARLAWYYFNTYERDSLNRFLGYSRETKTHTTWQDSEEAGEVLAAPVCLQTHAEQAATQAHFWQVVQNCNSPKVKKWLDVFMSEHCLHPDSPVVQKNNVWQLHWQHNAQKHLAEKYCLSTRTLRNYSKSIEAWLNSLQEEHDHTLGF